MTERIADAHRELDQRVQERAASLAEAQARLDHFFALSPDMLCMANMEWRLVRVNDAWHDVLGWSAEELTSRPYSDFVHPDDVGVTNAETARVADGATTLRFENRYRCKDGSYRWLSWRAAPDPSRGLIYAAAREVTERRGLERELQERAAELATLNAELEAFSYSVSHDLRAPLRHIAGFVALLEASSASKLNDEERRRLRTITEAANRMGHLIDDLLAFSRMGRTTLSTRRVSLDEVVSVARRELAADPNSERVTWNIHALPEVNGDPAMLRLVFVNLMSNALKYSRDTEDARIEIGEQAGNSEETVVFIRDNGVGFDMKYSDKLFGVFQRLHRADEFEGTGIGLANVRRIIHRHGGRTWAEGVVGAGATFFFTLPKT